MKRKLWLTIARLAIGIVGRMCGKAQRRYQQGDYGANFRNVNNRFYLFWYRLTATAWRSAWK